MMVRIKSASLWHGAFVRWALLVAVLLAGGASAETAEDKECLGNLLELLQHGSVEERVCAMRNLQEYGAAAHQATERLIELARDDRQLRVQREAIRTLRCLKLDKPAVISAYEEALASENGRIQFQACLGLASCSTISEDAVAKVLGLLGDADGDLAHAALNALAQAEKAHGEAVTVAVKYLDPERSQTIRTAALVALGAHGWNDEHALDATIACLNDASSSVRMAALRTLPLLGTAGLDALFSSISLDADPHLDVFADVDMGLSPAMTALRDATVKLVRPDSPTGVSDELCELLHHALHNDQPAMRYWSLGRSGSSAANCSNLVPGLLGALKDTEEGVRRKAIVALTVWSAEWRPQLPSLLEALNTKDTGVQNALGGAIAHVHGEKAIAELLMLAGSADSCLRSGAMFCLSHFSLPDEACLALAVGLLTDPSPQVRRGACTALGKWGKAADSALPDIQLLREDKNADVRRAANWATERIRSK